MMKTSADSPYICIADNLSLIYQNGFRVIDNISFSVKEGEITGLVGPNGSGKSSVMKLLAGLVRPESGTIQLCGENLFGNVGILQEIGSMINGPAVYGYLSAQENMELVKILYGNITYDEIYEMLMKLGLYEDRNQKVKSFSTGMKQKLSIGMTLLHKPRFLILDEPYNGLDPETASALTAMLEEKSESGCGILISSHILYDVGRLCDTVLFIKDGKIIANEANNKAKPEELERKYFTLMA